MKASILTIGTEILIGQIVDTNSAWLGSQLEQLGIQVIEIRSVMDKSEDMMIALEALSQSSDLIIMTGGLGPTQDDITKKVLAQFLETELYLDQALCDRIKGIYASFNYVIKRPVEEQSYLPKGTQKLTNNLGTAPGMWLEKAGVTIISMPGVPFEMKSIFSNEAIPKIKGQLSLNEDIYHKTILTAGEGESKIEEKLEDIISKMPEQLSIAFLPGMRKVRIRISGRGKSSDDLESKVNTVVDQIVALLGEIVYGYDKESLVTSIRTLCLEKQLKMVTAESCTGGLLASQIISEAGASAFFVGSIVAYSNELKQSLLGVSPETLKKEGAVSESTVKEMLLGALSESGANIGVAISGIAGPGGGTPDKPVGTVWFAYGNKDEIKTVKLQLAKDRAQNIAYSSSFALNQMRKFLLHQ